MVKYPCCGTTLKEFKFMILVEINGWTFSDQLYYKIGLEEEAKFAAVLLGYNYNSSEWYKKSYKILNKNYEPINIKKDSEDDSLIKRTIKKILFIDEKSGKN